MSDAVVVLVDFEVKRQRHSMSCDIQIFKYSPYKEMIMPWSAESTGASGTEDTSLAIDSGGNPHISFFDFASVVLGYAAKLGGVWVVDVVDPTSGAHDSDDKANSIAIDPTTGDPHIAYFSPQTAKIKYATKSGGVWSSEDVANTAAVPLFGILNGVSLAFDATGRPHVAWADTQANVIRYSVKSGGVWSPPETVDSINIDFAYPSLALDGGGNPHVVYHAQSFPLNTGFWHAEKIGGIWTPEQIDPTSQIISRSDRQIAIGSDGTLHACNVTSATGVMYASKIGAGPWVVETAYAFSTESEVSISIGSDLIPHLMTSDSLGRHLVKVGGVWTDEVAIPFPNGNAACIASVPPLLAASYSDGTTIFYTTFTPSGNFATVFGFVLNPIAGIGTGSGEPVSGATIIIGAHPPAVSDAVGFYTTTFTSGYLFNNPNTPLVVSAPGMIEIDSVLEVPVNTSSEVDFYMTPSSLFYYGGGGRVRKTGGTFRNPLNMKKGLKLKIE